MRNINKTQWYNLYHSFRWALQRMTYREAVAWIAHYNPSNARLLMRVREDF